MSNLGEYLEVVSFGVPKKVTCLLVSLAEDVGNLDRRQRCHRRHVPETEILMSIGPIG
jgi:hypothetical protein